MVLEDLTLRIKEALTVRELPGNRKRLIMLLSHPRCKRLPRWSRVRGVNLPSPPPAFRSALAAPCCYL